MKTEMQQLFENYFALPLFISFFMFKERFSIINIKRKKNSRKKDQLNLGNFIFRNLNTTF